MTHPLFPVDHVPVQKEMMEVFVAVVLLVLRTIMDERKRWDVVMEMAIGVVVVEGVDSVVAGGLVMEIPEVVVEDTMIVEAMRAVVDIMIEEDMVVAVVEVDMVVIHEVVVDMEIVWIEVIHDSEIEVIPGLGIVETPDLAIVETPDLVIEVIPGLEIEEVPTPPVPPNVPLWDWPNDPFPWIDPLSKRVPLLLPSPKCPNPNPIPLVRLQP